MAICRFRPQAFDDLNAVLDYIGPLNPTAARRLIDGIERTCFNVAETPLIGRERPEFGASLRGFRHRDYLIFYRPIEGGVLIVRVLHGARRVEDQFGPE